MRKSLFYLVVGCLGMVGALGLSANYTAYAAEAHITVIFDAGSGTFLGGNNCDSITYELKAGGYYQGPKEIQIPNFSSGNQKYMFEGWYTDPLLTAESRWTGLSASTTYTNITLYANYLPFNDKTQTWDGVTFTIMNKNLGASSLAKDGSGGKNTYGNYFQRGNNFGFPNAGSLNNVLLDALVEPVTDRGPGNYYYNGIFIKESGYDNTYFWDLGSNRNLWGGSGESQDNANADTDKQGPCPAGYHVPSTFEWIAARSLFDKRRMSEDGQKYCSGKNYCMLAALNMPLAGYRSYAGDVTSQGEEGLYWSASPGTNNNYARRMRTESGEFNDSGGYRTVAQTVRCFKDSPDLTLTFNSNGGTEVENQTGFKRWNPRNTKPTPTRVHSTFSGWYSDEDLTQEFIFSDTTYISENKTLYAQYECNIYYTGSSCEPIHDENNNGIADEEEEKFTVTIEVNNLEYGTISSGNVANVLSGTSLATSGNELKIGNQTVIVTPTTSTDQYSYSFTGWESDCGNAVTGNCTITGNFARTTNQYTITFDSDGGTAVSPITQNYDTEVTVPVDPSRTGYTFKGWNPSVPAKMPAENMTLTGIWEANEYTITFNSDGGSAVSPITGTYDSKLGTLPTTTRIGYTFSGWYDGEELYTSETVYKLTTGVELKAKWNANIDTNYGVEYYYQNIENNDYSLSGTLSKTGTTNTLATAETPAVEGFTFNSGYVNNVLTGIINGNGNLVLKVYYSRNSHTLTYKVDNEGYGEVESHKYGESIMLRFVPNKIGYVFSGWNNTVATMPDSNVEITGVFNTGSYDAVFKINGTVCGISANVLFGDNITVPALCVAADGYELGDWNPSELVMNSEGKEFTTTSTPMIYSITYELSGGVNNVSNPNSYTVESETITLQNPTRANSHFDGWTPTSIPSGSTGNKTFTADWSCNTGYHTNSGNTACVINTYTVNFVDWDGASLSSQIVNYGSSAVAPENPSRTGYTFKWWNPSDFSSITSNLTITGQYEINTYNLEINYNYSRGGTATGSYNTGVIYNTDYYVVSPSIPYYTANPLVVSGTMADTGVIVNVVYAPIHDENGNGIADEEEDDKFTVSFTALGSGTLSGTTSYSDILSGLSFIQAGIEIPETVANQYYEFSGWTPATPIVSMIVTGDLTFTAEFNPIKDENGNGIADEEEFFSVTFDSKGGSAVTGQTVKYGERATEPGKPIKSGQTFTGWYEDESYNTIWDFATRTITQNQTLFAKWTDKSIENITIKTNPEKTGYIEGEVIDMSGLVIEVIYDNGETGTVAYPTSGLTLNPEGEIAKGTTGIEITYGGETVIISITVESKPESSSSNYSGVGRRSYKIQTEDLNQNDDDSEYDSFDCGNSDRNDSCVPNQYSEEMNDAYKFAYKNGITTMDTIHKADMDGYIIRSHLAKMLSQFAINVMGKKPNTGRVDCANFADIQGESEELKGYIKTACELGLMGLQSDGESIAKNFNPNSYVSRAEFGTTLSRLLYGDKNNLKTEEDNEHYQRYEKHLLALKEEGIMTQITLEWITNKELRGYVMLMLMRSVK